MDLEDIEPRERLPAEVRHAFIPPLLRDMIRQQDLLTDALSIYDANPILGGADDWQRIRDGFLSTPTWALTQDLSAEALRVRESLLPFQLGRTWDQEAMHGMLSSIADAQSLGDAIPDLSGLQQYRELTLRIADMHTVDMGGLFPSIRMVDETLLRATELRAGISMRQEFLTPQLGHLVRGLDSVTEALEDVWRSAQFDPNRWLAYPSFVREGPSLGLFEATRSTGALVEIEEPLLEGPEVDDEGAIHEKVVRPRLLELGPEYVERYLGALSAMRARGPDWFRHASVSMRELILDIIRMLAPDEEVFSWNPEAERDRNGKPTYRTRLDFIFRDMGTEFALFAERDNDHIRQTIIALNEGTHRPAPPFNEIAQRSTILRSQHAISYLLIALE